MDAVLEFFRAALAASVALFVPAQPPAGVYYGYVEADYERLAARDGGTLVELLVARGARVERGQLVARFDDAQDVAQLAEANARLAQARAQLADLQKGSRSAELEVLEAQRAQVQAALARSQAEFERQSRLVGEGVLAAAQLDPLRAAYDGDRARLAELDARVAVARAGGRSDQIVAAEAAVAAAQAVVEQAEWRIGQRVLFAPSAGRVTDTLFAAGEFVPPGSPVVTLLPDGGVLLRFFVPEAELGAIVIGEQLALACDGCADGLTARIAFVAPEPEFTPPVIYSRDNRARLVFLVEAAPEQPAGLHPGQPIEVRRQGAAP